VSSAFPLEQKLDRLVIDRNKPVSISADDARAKDCALCVHMLMTMQKQSWPCSLDTTHKCTKAKMDLVIAVVGHSRRVVRNKDVNRRKLGKKAIYLRLLEKIVSFRLVLPRTAKTTERETKCLASAQVQISNRRFKGSAAIVIPFHSEHFQTPRSTGDSQDDLVEKVAAGYQDVCSTLRKAAEERIVISDHEDGHSDQYAWDKVIGVKTKTVNQTSAA
jgi:hypothetical protein